MRVARGYWNDPLQVPTIRGDQIALAPSLRLRKRGLPELLLPSPVPITCRFTLWVFSGDDLDALKSLEHLLSLTGVEIREFALHGYDSRSPDTRVCRSQIVGYFEGKVPYTAKLDFDRVR